VFTDINITTPAILFSTISMVHIAYTNRFIAISNLIRGLKDRYTDTHDENIIHQINKLRKRLYMIRNMQLYGIISLLLSIVSIILMYMKYQVLGEVSFGLGLLFLFISVLLAGREIWVSVNALDIELNSMEEIKQKLDKESQDLYLTGNIKKISKATKDLLTGDEHDADKP
jgi:hypothetical protein